MKAGGIGSFLTRGQMQGKEPPATPLPGTPPVNIDFFGGSRRNNVAPQNGSVLNQLPAAPNFQEIVAGQQQNLIPQGGFQAPQVQLPSLVDLAGQAKAAQQAFGQPESFLPQIQQIGVQQQQQAEAALSRLFERQTQERKGALAAQGVVGATQLAPLKDLAETQAFTLGQTLGDLQTENLKAQIAEQQRLGNISENRAQLLFGVADQNARFQVAQQQQAELETRAQNLEAQGLFQDASQLKLQALQLEQSQVFQRADLQLREQALRLDEQGLLNDAEAQDFREASALMDKVQLILQLPNLDDEKKSELINQFAEALETFF